MEYIPSDIEEATRKLASAIVSGTSTDIHRWDSASMYLNYNILYNAPTRTVWYGVLPIDEVNNPKLLGLTSDKVHGVDAIEYSKKLIENIFKEVAFFSEIGLMDSYILNEAEKVKEFQEGTLREFRIYNPEYENYKFITYDPVTFTLRAYNDDKHTILTGSILTKPLIEDVISNAFRITFFKTVDITEENNQPNPYK